jgi:hypothetical protein
MESKCVSQCKPLLSYLQAKRVDFTRKKVSPTCSVFFTPSSSKPERFSLLAFSAFLKNETRLKFVQDLYKKI